MSNTTATSNTFKPVAPSNASNVLRELFQATPLYIFATAAMAAFSKPAKR